MKPVSPPLPFPKHQLLQENPIAAFSTKQKSKFLRGSAFLTTAPVELPVPRREGGRKHPTSGAGAGSPAAPAVGQHLVASHRSRFAPAQRVFHFLVSSVSLSVGGRDVEREKRTETPAGHAASQDFRCCWRSKTPGEIRSLRILQPTGKCPLSTNGGSPRI